MSPELRNHVTPPDISRLVYEMRNIGLAQGFVAMCSTLDSLEVRKEFRSRRIRVLSDPNDALTPYLKKTLYVQFADMLNMIGVNLKNPLRYETNTRETLGIYATSVASLNLHTVETPHPDSLGRVEGIQSAYLQFAI